jgi:hypothetical protein
MKREYETALHYAKPKGEPYCCGCWRVVIDDEEGSVALVCDECGERKELVDVRGEAGLQFNSD